MKHINLKIDDDRHASAKMAALVAGKTLQDFVIDAIDRQLVATDKPKKLFRK
jgi:uncharacterized protein (DUF1778 family)